MIQLADQLLGLLYLAKLELKLLISELLCGECILLEKLEELLMESITETFSQDFTRSLSILIMIS